MSSDLQHLTIEEITKLAKKRYHKLAKAAKRGKKSQAKKAADQFNIIRSLGKQKIEALEFALFPDNKEIPL